MYVVEITIKHYPDHRNIKQEPEERPTSTWSDRSCWPDSFDGFRRTPAGVLNDALRRMTTQVLPEPDASRGDR